MAENLFIDKTQPDDKIYEALLPQVESLLDTEMPVVSNLANFVSALYNSFDKISWCGFYLSKGDRLYLGPFNGNTACTVINFGKGVCGKSAATKETVIVEDVDKFPGHIACEAATKSEIVVPVIVNGKVYGVLDLDSRSYSAFNETDKKYLEKLVDILTRKCDLNNGLL